MTKADKIKAELDAMLQVAHNVNQKIEELTEALRVAKTPAPPAGSWLTVEVKFVSSIHWYRYLILHVPGKGYYTTGSMDENKYFESWEEMLAYFNKDDVEKRSEFFKLTSGTGSYGGSFDRGAW